MPSSNKRKEHRAAKKANDKQTGDLAKKMAGLHVTPRSRFLKLPPELRNRIYFFAQSPPYDYYGLEPPLLVKSSKPLAKDWPYSSLSYRALTMVKK
jgi:hypothetical protein